ncbi:hypothetical protein DXG01_009874 [Tephrocybe rancida]|nr:hypothetical protein DXG01_009874 [Tephrocybe rancida]
MTFMVLLSFTSNVYQRHPAILYYDYALTLPAEIDRFWSTRTISWVSGFYYLNRYLTLFGHIPVMVQQYWAFEGPSVTQAIVGILLIMRTYALYDRSLRVLLFILTCALAAIIFGMWSVASGHRAKTIESYIPQAGCIQSMSMVE